jgi:hypothetical protein
MPDPRTPRSRSIVGAAAALALGLLVGAMYAASTCQSNQLGHLEASDRGDMSLGRAPRGRYDRALVAACGDGALTRHGHATILRRPYLQRTTSDGSWVVWTAETGAAMTAVVTRPDGAAIGTVDAEVDDTAPLPRGRQYVARLRALEPATIYCYELRDGDGALAGRTGFRTAPAPDRGAPVRFAALGDLGLRTVDQAAVLEQLKTVEPDLIVLTGDLAYTDGTLAEFETELLAPYADVMRNIPVFPASGNHEYRTADAAPFRQVFALPDNGGPAGRERWYSFDWGDVHFAVVDTERIGDAQLDWLDRDLERNRLPWTIVVGHRPPYASGHHGSDLEMRDEMVPIFERRRVPLVLLGHEHHYQRTEPIDGVTYVVSGGGGRGTRRVEAADYTAFAEQVSHFVYVIVEGTELRLWAIDAEGNTFDTLRLRLGAPHTGG